MPIETAKNLPVGGVDTLVFHYGFSIFISIDPGEGSQYAQRLFFASVVSAMQIPERQHSELTESVRVFELGEEALTECWRTWRMCLDNSPENNRHFVRERWYSVRAKQPRVRSSQAPVTRSTAPGQKGVAAVIQVAASNAR